VPSATLDKNNSESDNADTSPVLCQKKKKNVHTHTHTFTQTLTGLNLLGNKLQEMREG